ncbi:GNAT family N-acetyltransferase [Undibacterium fentianense]|uniref:GNAT family N-acetyltransferase n=1 Tax=Undibacterium fentianense TaxID=2828728 RepID=A0A941E6W8_9BURK|nr:GNAT family N-acetyltransferase [Undibacterium fentianense]MBR7800863.1 GNAT family N-acetyltransferase [Undibacterium fentianense]
MRLQISTEKARLDVGLIHQFLTHESTWAIGIPLELVKKSIDQSLCFGAYIDDQQIGFARVVSDFSTFAYLMDVFILPAYRAKGYSRQLPQAVFAHPDLQGLRRFMLASSNARGLYQQFGFQQLAKPEIMMEINQPGIYQNNLAV